MRAVIFANGVLEDVDAILEDIREDDLVIAADGGAQHCFKFGFTPNIIIGDMDSIETSVVEEFKSQKVKFITYHRNKNETDLELALTYAVNKGIDRILFLGLLGGRLDQSLANLLLLSRDEWKHVDLVVFQGADIAYLMRDEKRISLPGRPGDLVSLIPLSKSVTGVSTKGLRWALEDADLFFGHTLSVSNEMIAPTAQVEIQSGILYLVHRSTKVAEREDNDHEE